MLNNLYEKKNTLKLILNEEIHYFHSFKNNTCKNNNQCLIIIKYLEILCALLYLENIYSSMQRNFIFRRCSSGFIGPDCYHKCPYPWFGYDCKYKCTCPSLYCHHKYGCPQGNSFFLYFKRSKQKSNWLEMNGQT